jgi:hypothetical protein
MCGGIQKWCWNERIGGRGVWNSIRPAWSLWKLCGFALHFLPQFNGDWSTITFWFDTTKLSVSLTFHQNVWLFTNLWIFKFYARTLSRFSSRGILNEISRSKWSILIDEKTFTTDLAMLKWSTFEPCPELFGEANPPSNSLNDLCESSRCELHPAQVLHSNDDLSFVDCRNEKIAQNSIILMKISL